MNTIPPKYPIKPDEEPPVTTLGDVLSTTGAASRPVPVLTSTNMGNTTFTMSLPVQTFMERSEVANERGLSNFEEYEGQDAAQRPLDQKHACLRCGFWRRPLQSPVTICSDH